MGDARETGRGENQGQSQEMRKLIRNFRAEMEKFLAGGGVAGRMMSNDFSFENNKTGAKSLTPVIYREEPLFANKEDWPEPPLSGSTVHAFFLKKGEYFHLSLRDNFGSGLIFPLEEGKPDVLRMNFIDPRTEQFEDRRLQTPVQKLEYGLFLLSRLEAVRPAGNPISHSSL